MEETFGLKVVPMSHTLSEDSDIYANPQKRAQDLMEAFANPEIKAQNIIFVKEKALQH